MQNLKSITCVLLCGLAAIGLATTTARATVIYSYTGNNFDTFYDETPPAGHYDATMSVSGSFTTAAPLIFPLEITEVTTLISSYSFTDGRFTVDQTNSELIDVFVQTDTEGKPEAWIFVVVDQGPQPRTPTFTVHAIDIRYLPSHNYAWDEVEYVMCAGWDGTRCHQVGNDHAWKVGSPGQWTMAPGTIPEPSTLLLFGVGLSGLAGIGWHRRQV